MTGRKREAMKTIIIIGIIFCVYKIISKLSAESKERQQEAERQRIQEEQAALRAEQARQREEIKAQIERNKLEVKERIEAEKRRIEWQKRQDAINTRLEKEQERQAKELERHDEMINKMQFKLDQALEDIPMLKRQLSVLYAQMNIMQDDLDSANRAVEWDEFLIREGGNSVVSIKELEAHRKAKAQAENKILTQEKKIRTVEKQLAKAEFDRDAAKRKLA